MKSISYSLLVNIVIVIISFTFFQFNEDSYINVLRFLEDNLFWYSIASFLILASDIVLAVPSNIVLYFNGYFVGIIAGTSISLCGLMAGSIIGYYIGRKSSIIFRSNNNQRANRILTKYGLSAIFLTRGIPILSESICFVCGYNKISFRHYLLCNFLGYLPICSLHAIFGKMGYVDSNIFLLSFACSIAISVAFWYFGRKVLEDNDLTSDK